MDIGQDSPFALFNLSPKIQPLFKAASHLRCSVVEVVVVVFTSSSRREILGKITVFSLRGEMKHSVCGAISIV